MEALFSTPRGFAGLAVAGAVAAMGAALISQYGFGLRPCELCLWQRWPYLPGIGLGALGLLLWPRPLARFLFLLAALSFAVGAGIAVFHSGVELGLWKGLEHCSAPDPGTLSATDLLSALEQTDVVRCDERKVFFAGLSMTNYNALISTGFSALLILAAIGRAGRDRSAL
ncbi:MAG: disulfide bond formation protein B [Neomegalonema sp.]|nr:disulfide bond formation protein B [Neomegalonema sp.]